MSAKLTSALRRVTASPVLNIAVGLIFFATGAVEVWEAVASELESAGVGAHHGAALFGLWHAVKHLPEFFEGMEYLQGPEH